MPGGMPIPPMPPAPPWASIIFIMSSGSIDCMIPAAAVMAAAQASLSSSRSDMPGIEAIIDFIMGLESIICRDSSSFSGSFMYSENIGELVSSFIIFIDSAMSGMPPPAPPPMPPAIILEITSSSPPAPPMPFIMSARLSVEASEAGAAAAAVVVDFFLEDDDDFLEGTQFSWSPSATPASDKLESAPHRLPLWRILPCLEGGIPLCSSRRSWSSDRVVTSSIWYFFPLRVTWTFETGVGAAAEAMPTTAAPMHNFSPDIILMVLFLWFYAFLLYTTILLDQFRSIDKCKYE
mmetsp:Transcript_10496/g.22110  ORF Transcript_10496/g.22110 Transcript_10496/m.22110 type:complete len:292 (-) Transcript_10496:78-953(-)